MSKENKERAWEQVQIKAFTSWLNSTLEKRKLSIDDIKSDLSDGVRLINFLEILSNKKVTTKYDEKPPSRIQKIQNLHIALKFLEKEMDVKLHGIGAEDFADQNLKLILGFLWTLFKQYKINVIKHEDKSSEEGLLAWCKQTTAGYKDVNVTDFKTSFRDGKAFLALVDKYLENKEIFDFDAVSDKSPLENLNAAFDAAEKQLGVPKLLEAQEVTDGSVDDRSLVLYISLYFHAFVAKQQQKLIELEKRQIEERVKGLEGSLEQRAARGAELEEENLRLLKELEALKADFESQKRENNELKDKNAFLEERVNVLQQLLETANQEKENNQASNSSLTSELNKTKEELNDEKNRRTKLEEVKLSMEEQVGLLQGQVDSLSTKLENETTLRRKENEDTSSRNRAEVDGLGVLKRNLEQHIEDLFRWQKFLDAENDASVDFTGELRPQIIAEISKSNFDEQLKAISAKLEKENEDLEKLLKQKEVEQKAKKAQEEKKRERQKKNEN